MTTRQALAQLMLVFIDGRNYQTQNPYMRPEIDAGFKALKLDKFKTETDELRAIARGARVSTHRKHRY